MSDELREEYEFDYQQAKPNRFAAGMKPGGRLVALEPEVAAAFPGSDEVNAVLKLLIGASRGDRAKFDEALRLVPDVEPEEHDRILPKTDSPTE
jgi:hypothetical protein